MQKNAMSFVYINIFRFFLHAVLLTLEIKKNIDSQEIYGTFLKLFYRKNLRTDFAFDCQDSHQHIFCDEVYIH